MQKCPYCSSAIKEDTEFCQKCGARIKVNDPINHAQIKSNKSAKSGKTALLLCIFLGTLGIHRFYVGKIVTGILTLVTGGFLGLWTILDLIRLSQNKFKDRKDNYLIVTKNLSSPSRVILIIGAITSWLIIVIGSLLIFASYLTSGLVNIANEQLTALRTGNMEEAYSYTSKAYQKAISLENFKKWLDQFPELKNNKSIVFNQRGLNNSEGFLDSGFLAGTLTTNNGKQIEVKYLFLKEDGSWKIVGIFI